MKARITTFPKAHRLGHSLKIVATGVILALSAPVYGKEPLHGTATVVDGDTLDLGPSRIRLFGIDAPELAQTCAAIEERKEAVAIGTTDCRALIVF